MKAIVEHDDKASQYLAQYTNHIVSLSDHYKVLDIEEKYLPWLEEIVKCTEPDFILELREEQSINESLVQAQPIILASIGKKQASPLIDIYYNMKTHSAVKALKERVHTACEYISCYSEDNQINATHYIECIRYLTNLAREYHKPIIIYANLYVPNEIYRYRTLTCKIINSCLKAVNGLLMIRTVKEDISKYYHTSQKSFEVYVNRTIYFTESINDVIQDAVTFLSCRQNEPLYDDVFYRAISPEEDIYTVIRYSNLKPPEYYEAMGFRAIRLIGNYSMLHGKKSQFDALSSELRPEVGVDYPLQILTHISCNMSQTNQPVSYDLVNKDLKYKGEGVYIGIITVDDVDYSSEVLRTPEGESRIACIWRQSKADEGEYYFKDQINGALENDNPSSIIPLPEGESMSTMMLSIAGGSSKEVSYRGIAPKAEFVVAKINPASDEIQRIYGGIPNKYGITLPDAMVGIKKLIDFATEQGKPLAICMPFNGNISAHDGSLVIEEILGEIARTAALTLIIPTGEEADKRHHYEFEEIQEVLESIDLNIEKENQNVVGIFYERSSAILTAELYAPSPITAEPVNLKRKGVTRINESTVYSNGLQIDFLNGSNKIHFRIDNPRRGRWRIRGTLQTNIKSRIDLWISQQQLNEYITLTPSNTATTIGSSACINNVMSVGGYDKNAMVVLRSSGRGYTRDGRVTPLFVTNGRNITASCIQGKWVNVTGTLPAASIMLGAVADYYSKFIAEKMASLPNTLVMNSIVLSAVRQQEEIAYPNPSQGYGIFDVQSLE
ncbi:MAG: hypothetical protein K0S71_1460 [Clostridia bacterium]|jgi:hypothetical protein|nr:hypothetical protein [Clostridia bacterium]